jgi:hypothetical protein
MASDLIPIQKQNEIISQLPIVSQKYLVAKNGNKISELKTGTAIKTIVDIVVQSMINSGNKKDIDDTDLITNIAETIYQLIMSKYMLLTVEEFKLICFNGVTNEYGDYFGINLTTISNWIKSFINDTNRQKAMREYNKELELILAKSRKLDPSETRQIVIDGCKLAYVDFIKYDKMPVPALSGIYYDLLWKDLKILNYDKSIKNEIAKVVESKYIADLNVLKSKRVLKQNDYENIISNIETNRSLYNLVKQAILRKFFNELKENNETLNI